MISYEKKEKLQIIRINRGQMRNVFTLEMLKQLAEAYTAAEDDPEIRCSLLYAEGKHFTLGLDLPSVSKGIRESQGLPFGENTVNPFQTEGRRRNKPVVAAAHGMCFTLGIELLLAADVRLAAEKTIFSQLEVGRGIIPFGGATLRFPQVAGWGNAMRYMLTGEQFGSEQAQRMGLIQEVTPKDSLVSRAEQLAQLIAEQAPLAVQETIRTSRVAAEQGFAAGVASLMPTTLKLMDTEDAAEGVRSFEEKRKPEYYGR